MYLSAFLQKSVTEYFHNTTIIFTFNHQLYQCNNVPADNQIFHLTAFNTFKSCKKGFQLQLSCDQANWEGNKIKMKQYFFRCCDHNSQSTYYLHLYLLFFSLSLWLLLLPLLAFLHLSLVAGFGRSLWPPPQKVFACLLSFFLSRDFPPLQLW